MRRTVALAVAVIALAGGMWGSRPAPAGSPSPTPSALLIPPPSPSSSGSVSPSASPSIRPVPRECGSARGRLVRFRVDVQDGIPVTPGRFRRDVSRILCDSRSWIASGNIRFRYDPDARLRIRLLDPDETEARCLRLVGKSVNRTFSCAGRREVVLNSARWLGGSPWWPGPLDKYRHLLVNHEVGHVLGLHHRSCSRAGSFAPVMMQQSKGLHGCRANPWPRDDELSRVR